MWHWLVRVGWLRFSERAPQEVPRAGYKPTNMALKRQSRKWRCLQKKSKGSLDASGMAVKVRVQRCVQDFGAFTRRIKQQKMKDNIDEDFHALVKACFALAADVGSAHGGEARHENDSEIFQHPPGRSWRSTRRS